MTEVMYEKLVRMNDASVEAALDRQVTEPSSRFFGGIISDSTGIPLPSHGGTPSSMAAMASALINPDSKYYQDELVLSRFEMAADYMLALQHDDGTISLGSTNFHSPPDTGFVVTGMGQLYRLLEGNEWTASRPVTGKVKLFLERTLPALLTGGCHTPNHRWVMTSALGWLYDIFRLEALKERAAEWLAEGMDCTEDGEWTERSNGIYNTVSDIHLYHTAMLLGHPEVLEPVRRNLHMMVYMLHPDGSVVTEYSGRQDFGERTDLSPYFLVYRLMAALDRDPVFAAMADLSAAHLSTLGSVNNHAMLGYLLFPQTRIDDLERAELPDKYIKIINEHHPAASDLENRGKAGHHDQIMHSAMHLAFGSPVARHRDGATSATVITRAPSVFSLRHGKVSLQAVQLFTSFTPGLVEMEQFEKSASGGYRMGTLMEKGYNGPIPKQALPPSASGNVSPWYLLPHQLRPMTHLQKHLLQVEVTPGDAEWVVRVRAEDLPDVFTQVVFSFRPDCGITGEGLLPIESDAYFWTGGSVRCEAGDDWIELTSGAHDHKLEAIRASSIRGGLKTLRVNLLTPFDHTFRLRLSTGGVTP